MKKLFAVILCVALAAVMFAGCSDAGTTTATEDESMSAEPSQTEAAETPSDTNEESGSEAEASTETGLIKIVPEGDIVVGISTGSSGTSWRDIMISDLESVGEEYKASGKIKDY